MKLMQKGCSFYNSKDREKNIGHGFQDDQSETENILGKVRLLIERRVAPILCTLGLDSPEFLFSDSDPPQINCGQKDVPISALKSWSIS